MSNIEAKLVQLGKSRKDLRPYIRPVLAHLRESSRVSAVKTAKVDRKTEAMMNRILGRRGYMVGVSLADLDLGKKKIELRVDVMPESMGAERPVTDSAVAADLAFLISEKLNARSYEVKKGKGLADYSFHFELVIV